MAISNILGTVVANVSHFLGTVKANVSEILGATASFGGGGGGNTVTWEATSDPSGTAANGSSITHPYSGIGTISSGELLVLMVSMKPITSGSGGVSTPTDWTAGAFLQGTGLGSPSANDTGDTYIYTFYKIADGTESGTLTVNLSGNNVALSRMHRFSKDAGTWNVAGATTQQGSTGNISVTFGSDPGVQTGDYALVVKAANTDVGGGSAFSAGALSQTGVTFGTVTKVSENSSTSGFDIVHAIWRSPVTAGTSSAAPGFTATCSGDNGIGPLVFIRVRAA